jgi:hypothetical protein
MVDTVPRTAVIHPLLRAAYRETKRAWRKAEPTSFATLVGGMLPTVEGGDA